MKLSEWLRHIDARLERIEEAASEIREKVARNSGSLDEHIRRSDALEESLDILRSEVRPLSTHVAVVAGLAKALGGLAVLAGAALAVAQLMGWR